MSVEIIAIVLLLVVVAVVIATVVGLVMFVTNRRKGGEL
jgi:hypothetical protein